MLEPYDGKLSRTGSEGGRGPQGPLAYPVPGDFKGTFVAFHPLGTQQVSTADTQASTTVYTNADERKWNRAEIRRFG